MIGLLKVVRASLLGLRGSPAISRGKVARIAVVATVVLGGRIGGLLLLLLLGDALGALRSVRRVPQRLPLLDFLVQKCQRVLQVRRLLLIKRRHAKLLVDKSLMLAA